MRIYKFPIQKLGLIKPEPIGETMIDKWCKERELIRNKDYKCFYMSKVEEYHVSFNEEHETMGSLLLLAWL